MYRDFQSRNVMIRDGEPWLIDFQGGRRGPFYYDVASFSGSQGEHPRQSAAGAAGQLSRSTPGVTTHRKDEFSSRLRHFVLFRTLQVLGAYGFGATSRRSPTSCRVCLYSQSPRSSSTTATLVSLSRQHAAPPAVDMHRFTDG